MDPHDHDATANPIRAARARLKLTQPAAAALLGYSPSYFAMMEREPRCLAPRMARRLVAVLGVSRGDLERLLGFSLADEQGNLP